jgi:tetratricopeptide (TPR) repeat protein
MDEMSVNRVSVISSTGDGAPVVSPGPSAEATTPNSSTSESTSAGSLITISPFFGDEKAITIIRQYLPELSTESLRATQLFFHGEPIEARRIFNRILNHTSTERERFYVSNQLAKISRSQGENEQAISIHLLSAYKAGEVGDYLSGNWCNGLGNSRLLQGDWRAAVTQYEAAASHFIRINSFPDYAIAQNNIAFVEILEGNPQDAITRLLEARELLSGINHSVRVAEVEDTLAMAQRLLHSSVETLERESLRD